MSPWVGVGWRSCGLVTHGDATCCAFRRKLQATHPRAAVVRGNELDVRVALPFSSLVANMVTS